MMNANMYCPPPGYSPSCQCEDCRRVRIQMTGHHEGCDCYQCKELRRNARAVQPLGEMHPLRQVGVFHA